MGFSCRCLLGAAVGLRVALEGVVRGIGDARAIDSLHMLEFGTPTADRPQTGALMVFFWLLRLVSTDALTRIWLQGAADTPLRRSSPGYKEERETRAATYASPPPHKPPHPPTSRSTGVRTSYSDSLTPALL